MISRDDLEDDDEFWYRTVGLNGALAIAESLKELKEYNDKSNSYIMNNFYVWQRKRLNLFVTEDMKPYYGKWSFTNIFNAFNY
jgi:deoxyribodipyrimidine photolyase-like uncharacterized protein